MAEDRFVCRREGHKPIFRLSNVTGNPPPPDPYTYWTYCSVCGEMIAAEAGKSDSPRAAGEGGHMSGTAEILDACCGGRMWWWDKAHPLAVYMDTREAPRGAVGTLTSRPEWNPAWECAPDVLGDFRAMPFEDGSFQQVVFDPPHIVRASQPPEGINGLKYGALHPDTEQDDLRRGFAECWRVLAPGGTLVFKWAGALDRVEPHFPTAPTVGSRNAPRGSKGLGTRWFIFYKPMLHVHPMLTGAVCSWCHRKPGSLPREGVA